MNKLIVLLAVVLFSFSLAAESMNHDMKGMKMEAKNKTADASKLVECPVTKTKLDPKNTSGTSVYKGKTYYFCCEGCKPMFDKKPSKYLKR